MPELLLTKGTKKTPQYQKTIINHKAHHKHRPAPVE